jgi:putative ABC transport system ATP-binding protein
MGPRDLVALDSASFQVLTGESVAIVGPSGSGKSTLMSLLGCLDTPSAGSLKLAGQDVSRLSDMERARTRNQLIGFVFQSFHLIPRMSAIDNVAVPLLYGRVAGAHDLAREALEAVGLGDRLHHLPTELSGGEQQRVAIARAIANNPSLLLADEPTGNLDSSTGEEILTMLEALVVRGLTLVVVTHDATVAARSSHVLHMRDGRIEKEVYQDPVRTVSAP